MRKNLSERTDFKCENNMIEIFRVKSGHIPIFWPKFHPELNPIERVWAQLKRYTKAHCKYSVDSIRKNIQLSYDTVTLENIENHLKKC